MYTLVSKTSRSMERRCSSSRNFNPIGITRAERKATPPRSTRMLKRYTTNWLMTMPRRDKPSTSMSAVASSVPIPMKSARRNSIGFVARWKLRKRECRMPRGILRLSRKRAWAMLPMLRLRTPITSMSSRDFSVWRQRKAMTLLDGLLRIFNQRDGLMITRRLTRLSMTKRCRSSSASMERRGELP